MVVYPAATVADAKLKYCEQTCHSTCCCNVIYTFLPHTILFTGSYAQSGETGQASHHAARRYVD